MTYLTEQNLIDYLNIIFPSIEWIHDKPLAPYRFRPDYRCDELKLLVEFDGFQHYTKSTIINKDKFKDKQCLELGYQVIRIPYFVQMSKEVIKYLFDKEVSIEQTYPHGFIADNATLILPCDFCEIGLEKFKEDLNRFSFIRQDIVSSIDKKIEKLGIENVLPPSLYFLSNI